LFDISLLADADFADSFALLVGFHVFMSLLLCTLHYVRQYASSSEAQSLLPRKKYGLSLLSDAGGNLARLTFGAQIELELGDAFLLKTLRS